MTGKLVVVGVLGAILLAGCSGSDSQSDSSSPPASQSSAASDDGGCSVATVDGTTQNQAMQDLATEVYESLRCTGDQTLDDQLRAEAESDDVKAAATEAGLTINIDSAAGGTVMQIVQAEDRSACSITVIDDLDAKTLTCADL